MEDRKVMPFTTSVVMSLTQYRLKPVLILLSTVLVRVVSLELCCISFWMKYESIQSVQQTSKLQNAFLTETDQNDPCIFTASYNKSTENGT